MTLLSRSPQVTRKKSKKVKGSPRLRKAFRENQGKSIQLSDDSDPLAEMSDIVLGCISEDVQIDHEFEIKRVPDFDKYLSSLLEETDPSHHDYEDLCRAVKRVRSMVKEKEEEEFETENQTTMDNIQDRFPQDDLQLSNRHRSSSSQDHDNIRNINNNNNNSNNTSNNDNNNNNSNNNSNHDVDNNSSGVNGHNSTNNKSGDSGGGGGSGGSGGNKNEPSDSSDKAGGKSRGLSLRRRSAPSAVLFKSISGSRSKSTNSLWSNAAMGKRDSDNVISSQTLRVDADSSRMFLMEGSVQLYTGMQNQDRYMFLFSDLLLLAKPKSSTAYKLKHRVQLCDMWIASCIEEVCENDLPAERSFVIGWPTTNVVVTFPTLEEKEKWLHTLEEGIKKEKSKDEGTTLQLKVAPRDIQSSSSKAACQMTITNETKAEDVLVQCLKQMSIAETESADYQLWVTSGKEGTPYPLIGHETPFSIKRNQLREVSRSKSRDEIDTMTSGDLHSSVLDNGGTSKEKCDFYIKQKKGQKKTSIDDPKKSKFKSPNFFSKFTKFIKTPKSQVFKLPLSECFTENNDPPEAIVKLMVLVYEKGVTIDGIMRRGNNSALSKEIREKIESGLLPTLEERQTPTVASVYKDFLRCIPGGLLTAKLKNQWMSISKDDPSEHKIVKIKEILNQLPPQHLRMLTLSICLLQHIAKHKEYNQMSPTNLATCIAPSFFPDSKQPSGKLTADQLSEVQHSMMIIRNTITPLIAFMIVKHTEIFGEDILKAFVPFGCSASPPTPSLDDGIREEHQSNGSSGLINNNVEDEGDEMFEEDEIRLRQHNKMRPTTRQSNSGTDSDSTHSVLSMADNGVVMRRDDSSIDSLVDRDYYPADSSPTVVKSHLSPSNLSRDSGLTLSDTQLYEEDGDITITGVKQYQRSNSHEDDLESQDLGIFDQNMQRRSEPVPPPRSNRTRKPRRGYPSEGHYDQHGYGSSGTSKPAPFLHSASTTALDYLPSQYSKSVGGNHSPMSHQPLGKRISSDSIGEEDESDMQQKASDFQRIRKGLDMGTIVKSDSGTHLFLREETQPSKYNLESGQRMTSKERFLRQSSVTDSTPPVSPQSRYSQSSRESVLSDSYSMSQESPGHSAPHTPDSLNDKPLSWSTSQSNSYKAIDPRLSQSLNLNYSNHLSKSTPNIAKDIIYIDDDEDNTDEDVPDGRFVTDSDMSSSRSQYAEYWSNKYQKYKPVSKPWSSQSHEAEEIEPRRRPNFSLMIPTDEEEFNFGVKSSSLPTTDKHQSLLKGSPPPSILLQNLQAPSRRESVPEKGSEKSISPHYRRSSADTVTQPPVDTPKSMNSAFKTEEYGNVSSKPIMISSPNPVDNQSSSSRAKLSRYMGPSVDLRPDKPPCYHQTLQRQFMIKQNVPVDIDMDDKQRQKENSYNARAMYEKSLQMYNEQRKSEVEDRQPVSAKALPESNISNLDYVNTDTSRRSRSYNASYLYNSAYLYNVDVSTYYGGASKNLSSSPDANDDSGASGFIDLGSISNSSQEDIIRRRNAHSGSGQKSQNVVSSSVSISRTDSKLSDTGSSSGSSATLSTLSRHSDSFGRRSDISNVTVSSVTSSDSNSEANSVMSHRKSGSGVDLHNMSYSRHFRPVEPEDDSDQDQEDDYEEEEYVSLRKNPQKLYQESKRIYEQGNNFPQSFVTSTSAANLQQPILSSSLSSSSSTASSSYSLTPRSNIVYSKDTKGTNQSKPTPQRVGSGVSDIPTHIEPSVQLNRQDSRSKQSTSSYQQPDMGVVDQNRAEPQRKFSLTEMQSDEHHNNFLKVRSLFYNPEDEQTSSPFSSPRFAASSQPSTLPHQPSTLPHQSSTVPHQPSTVPHQPSTSPHLPSTSPHLPSTMHYPPPTMVPTQPSVISSHSPTVPTLNFSKVSPRTNSDSKVVNSHHVPSPSTGENKELPWNVQKLKRLFDKSEDNSVTCDLSIGSIQLDSTMKNPSSARRRSPPPYNNPPPFQRTHNSRASTSSASSVGSEKVNSKTNTGIHRLGPQTSSRDSFNSSYSSSEESYNSLDRRSRKSSQDSESLSDHANITYV